MTIAVIIPTYQRTDGTTTEKLIKAISSVFNQTYQDFKIILVGDKYEDNNEFLSIVNKFDTSKIYFTNLKVAVEREKYIDNPTYLWNTGGVNANNVGLDIAKQLGIDWVAHLDHDDYWSGNHLQNFVEVIKNENDCAFVCSLARYKVTRTLPTIPEYVKSVKGYFEHTPRLANQIHSSICFNNKLLNVKYRNMIEEKGECYPSDGIFANDINQRLKDLNLKGYCYGEITCFHDTENE